MKKYILTVLFFLFPLFFLPFTQDFFTLNKLYLLIAAVLVLLVVSAISLIISKKLSWTTKPLDIPILLFITSVVLSTLISSSNKIQALYNFNFGVVMIAFLGLVYLYLSRSKDLFLNILKASGVVLSLVTIFFFLQPLKNLTLPTSINFLQNPIFTPMGGMLDLAVILGFFVVLSLPEILKPLQGKRVQDDRSRIYHLASIILPVIALSLTIYTIAKNNLLLLPPFSISWYAVLEVMKNVKTALFGVGVDNFSAAFTRVKDLAYNQSSVWQVPAFSVSRNVPFHVITEAGLLGIISFAFLIFTAFREQKYLLLIGYVVLVSLFFSPSLTLFFLLFLTLGLIAGQAKGSSREVELNEIPAAYIGGAVVLLAVVISLGYFAGRLYASEYAFKKSIDALISRDAKGVYDNMKAARSLNPYTERFVLNFSQTNLLIAESIAQKETITDEDRQTIAQAVQTSISEAKELIRLNPNKSQYYENLAMVYRNIIPLAQGSEAWAISAYQRAIALDPANPALRVDLGGIYYLLGRYGEAISFFEQAVTLKPDWPNAHYNLAWAYYQNKEYDKATVAMENVTKLINKNVSPEDFQKASAELENFKKELNLPEEKTATLEPRINLPESVAP